MAATLTFSRAFKGVGQPQDLSYYTGVAADDAPIDFSAAIRPLIDFQGTTIGVYNQIDGYSTAGIVAEAPGLVAEALKRRDAARRVGNVAKARLEAINAGAMTGLGTAGAGYLVYRSLAIPATLEHDEISPTSTSTFGKTAYAFGQAANVGLGIFYAGNSATSGWRLGKQLHFRAHLSEETIEERLEVAPISEDPQDHYVKGAEEGVQWLGRILEEMDEEGIGRPDVPEADKERVFVALAGGESEVRAIGKETLERNAIAVRDQELVDLVGRKCATVLKDEALSSAQKIERVKQKYNWGHYFKLLRKFILPIVGLLWVVFSFISDPVTNLAYGIQSAICFLFDIKGFMKWCKNGEPGKWDKYVTWFLLTMLTVSIVLTFVFPPFAALPLGMIIALTILKAGWMGMSVYKLMCIYKKEKEKPELGAFIEFLKGRPSWLKAQEVLARLPKEDQEGIVKAYKNRCHRKGMAIPASLDMAQLLQGAQDLFAKRKEEKRKILRSLKRQISAIVRK